MIRGTTTLIAHIGYPTATFKAPMVYNPYFEQAGIDAVVVPMGVKPDDYPDFLRNLFRPHEYSRRADHDAAQGDYRGPHG
jgi:shikimate dehydrogenase